MGEIQYAYPLIHNKVTSPHYVTPTLRRGRLLDWLNANQECRALVIAAGAGYGKTTLLWQWEREANFPCYWYKLDRNDRDWSLHISYLIEAVAQRHPGFGRRAHSMLLQLGGPGSSRPGVAAFLLSEMHDRLTEPCTFIIDDWHFVSSVTEVRGLWNQILRDAPPTCRFVFASRAKPQLQFARLKTHTGYGELRTDDLRLTDIEIDELFRDVYRDPLSSEELTELERRTEGWAASLQLVEVSLRERQTPEERQRFIESITATTESDLFSFLAEEVLDQQSEETRNFLLSTSILQQITPDLAERLAGVHDGVRRLLELEHAGLFTHRVDERQYRYHGLFREFLERRLIAERSEAEVLGLHIHAASYFETTARWPEAIHHYLRAGLQRQAARLIARYGEDVVAEGRLGLVDEWFQALPARTVRDNARLSLLHGETLGMRGEWTGALEALNRARQFFARKGDPLMEALACVKLSAVYHGLGKPETSGAIALEGLLLAPPDADVIRLRLDGNLAITVGWIAGPLVEAARTCERVAARAASMGLDHFAAIGLHNVGALRREMGDISESIRVLERAWRHWQVARVSPFAENTEFVMALLASDQPDRAQRVADAGVAGTRSWARPHLEAEAGRASVDIYRGLFSAAIARLRSLIAYPDLGITTELCRNVLMDAMLLANRPPAEIHELAEQLEGGPRDPRLAPVTDTSLALAAHAIGRCAPDCGRAARQTLDAWGVRGGRFSAVVGGLKLAIIALDHGAPPSNDRAVAAVSAVQSLKLVRYMRWWIRRLGSHTASLLESVGGMDLIRQALCADPEYWREPVAAAVRLMSPSDRQPLLEALTSHGNRATVELLKDVRGGDVTAARRKMVRRQAARIHIRTFGSIAVYRGGWTGRQLGVTSRRSRLLLSLLVANLGQPVGREVVLDRLWPDADPAAAINNLNQAVFQLRRQLEPSYRDGLSPAYVLASAESVELDADLVRTDLQEFRKYADVVRAGGREAPHAALSLIGLTRGEYLGDAKYEDWAALSASSVHNEVRSILLPVATGELLADRHDIGLEAACALQRLDQFDESAAIAIVLRLVALGRRAAARQAAANFISKLREELQEPPSEALTLTLTHVGLGRVLLDSAGSG
ncbi:MAG: hypothetical protein DLM71_10460 [Chloroflexi bacterium]|nr:MAG: hypothetical protein DLM71_10460 [Chloroflexota bacterium]